MKELGQFDLVKPSHCLQFEQAMPCQWREQVTVLAACEARLWDIFGNIDAIAIIQAMKSSDSYSQRVNCSVASPAINFCRHGMRSTQAAQPVQSPYHPICQIDGLCAYMHLSNAPIFAL